METEALNFILSSTYEFFAFLMQYWIFNAILLVCLLGYIANLFLIGRGN